MKAFSWVYLSMTTLVEKEIIKGRVLVNNVTYERLKLCPNHFPIAAKGTGCTPIQMVVAQLYPFSQNLTTFLFRQLAQDLSYFYMYTKKLGKQTLQPLSLNCTFTGSLYSLWHVKILFTTQVHS